jgi:hypothetical protein
MCGLSSRGAVAVAANSIGFFFLALFPFAQSQIPYQDQEIHVHDLPSLTAKSKDPFDVLLASLETILRDKDVCCAKDSALVDSLAKADPKSLKDVSAKIEGRQLLSDGRPIQIQTVYLTPEMVNGRNLVHMVLDQQAALVEWNSHLYVLHGVVFFWDSDGQGNRFSVIRKLLLWDTRYSDSRREVVFTRTNGDPGKVEGLLFVEVAK